MTQNNNDAAISIWPTVWKYGLIIAGFRIVYSLILFVTGLAGTTGTGLIGVIGAIVLLVFAVKSFRGLNNGYVTFGQAFGIGFVTAVIATVARAVVDTIYLSTLGRDFLAAQRDAVLNQMAANPAMDRQTLEMIRGFFDALFTPGGILVSAVCAGVLGWLIISLIVAATMKNPPPIAD